MPQEKKQKNQKKTNYLKTASQVAGLALKVAKLYSMLNTEKKRFDISNNSQLVAQLAINASGTYALDVTPIPAQGVAFNQRTGSSIKPHSAIHKFQFWSQSATTVQATKFRIEFWHNKGPTTSAAAALSEIYNVSTGSGIIDYNSQMDPDYTGTYTRFFRKNYVLPAPQYNGQVQIKDIVIPLRLKKHVRFNDNSTTVTDGQIIMFILADSGNLSTVSTATNVPVLTALSGMLFNQDLKYYYYDN